MEVSEMNRPAKKREQEYTLHPFNHRCMLGVVPAAFGASLQLIIYEAANKQRQ